jgi:L-fuconolactonase
MAEASAFRGNFYRHSVGLNRWIARARKEQALEPDPPIIDPHHHLWDDERGPYPLRDTLGDIGGGHNMRATVFIECRTHHRMAFPMRNVHLGKSSSSTALQP